MTTKRQVLIRICETPGWHPPEDSSSLDRFLEELVKEGWVISRLDGYEATADALDAYPRFDAQGDIADPTPIVASAAMIANTVPLDRVENLIAALMCEVPYLKVIGMVLAQRSQIPQDAALWREAEALAKRMQEQPRGSG